jgi:hypothetical protein
MCDHGSAADAALPFHPPPLAPTYPFRTLAELNLPHAFREVVDKSADAVLDEIEAAILLVAASILRGEGFTYTLPNRSKGNQLYVPGALHRQLVGSTHRGTRPGAWHCDDWVLVF